jgi:biotin carboxyl carrier protein
LAVEGFTGARQPVDAKVSELNPSSRAVNVLAKVMSKSEVRNVAAGRDGEPHKVSDAMVGDETGCIYLTLWDDNIEKVKEGDTVKSGDVVLILEAMKMANEIKSPYSGKVKEVRVTTGQSVAPQDTLMAIE